LVGWTLEVVDLTKCGSFSEEKISPDEAVDEIYFLEDSTATCYQVKENGASSITVGKCLPNGPNNTGHADTNENWECLGRCGVGCGDASVVPAVEHWSKGCLAHDLCTYFTDSPQDPDGAPNPLNSLTCKIAAENAAGAFVNPSYRWKGAKDSSYSKVCIRPITDPSSTGMVILP
jgi:hypothetical protein